MHGNTTPPSRLAPFDWEDPFRLNDQLTEEERMLRDAVDRLLREHCPLDHVREVAEGGHAVSFVMTDRQGREVEPGWEDGLRYFGAAQAERLRWRLEIAAPASGGRISAAAGFGRGVKVSTSPMVF